MRIYFCTTASSKKYKSWSNIPYLLHKSLEEKGFIVTNYLMWEIQPFKFLFNLPIRIFNKFSKLRTTYFYVRTPVHFFFTYLYSYWIKLISSSQDVMIVQGFSYPLNNGKNKQIILGDWPSEYLFERFLKRQPSRFERKSIDRENTVIENANAVITLFPSVQNYMLKKYKNKNIFCFGNVVNVDDDIIVPFDIRERKLNSFKLLFIGQPFYLSGAFELINAVQKLRQQGFDFEVDIVGISPNLIGIQYEWLNVHGYLDKSKSTEKRKYYDLLSNSRLFVNTTQGWSGFQAILEAMYFYNPIIIRPNDIVNDYFTNLENFAYLLDGNVLMLESIIIESVSNIARYQKMSDVAHKTVKSSTWNNFTNELINIIR